MKTLKATQDTGAEVITPAQKNAPFLYAEESGLALFQNRQSGRRFYMDKKDWVDLSLCVSDGWNLSSHGK